MSGRILWCKRKKKIVKEGKTSVSVNCELLSNFKGLKIALGKNPDFAD